MKTITFNTVSILLMVIALIAWVLYGLGIAIIAVPLFFNYLQVGWFLAILAIAIYDRS